MIYNFRFDRSQTREILRRLIEEKLLSQGWGGGLDADLRVDHPDFVHRSRERYGLATTRIPSNLLRMRDLGDGDLLVAPHLPSNGKVSIHIVAGNFPSCYDYLPEDPTHLNHRIRIAKSYGLNGEIDVQNARLAQWRGKLQWLRLPILPIGDFGEPFQRLVRDMGAEPQATFEASELDQYLEYLWSSIVATCQKDLAGIAASGGSISFEAVCERLVRAAGYEIEARNQYDRTGGDADLVCVRERSDVSVFETGTSTLLVQIKKHSGTTDEHAVRQVLAMLNDHSDADTAVMSLADGFSDSAVELAEKNGVALLNGQTICRLLLADLAATVT